MTEIINANNCSLVAQDLPNVVNGLEPTFSFHKSRFDDYFAIPMTYMNGKETCYHPPAFTPLVINTAARYTQTCRFGVYSIWRDSDYTILACPGMLITDIPGGPLTITNTGTMWDKRNTPLPLVVTIGPQPAPTTVDTATITDVSTTTYTSTSWGGFRSTQTDYVYFTTGTRTVWLPASETTTRTHYATSCPMSGPTVIPSLPPNALLNRCNDDDGKFVNTEEGRFRIVCGYEIQGKTSSLMQMGNSLLGCIHLCSDTKDCTGIAYVSGTDACYLKFGTGSMRRNPLVSGAVLVGKRKSSSHLLESSSTHPPSAPTASAPTTSDSTVSNSTASESTSSLTRSLSNQLAARFTGPAKHPLLNRWSKCPEDHRKIFTGYDASFIIACGYDHSGTAAGPYSTIGLNECIHLCAVSGGCVFASYYEKHRNCFLKYGHGRLRLSPESSGAMLRYSLPNLVLEDLSDPVVLPPPLSSAESTHSTPFSVSPTRPSTTLSSSAFPLTRVELQNRDKLPPGFVEQYRQQGPDYTFLPKRVTATITEKSLEIVVTTTTIVPWWQILGTTTTSYLTKTVTIFGWLMDDVRTVTIETTNTFCPPITNALSTQATSTLSAQATSTLSGQAVSTVSGQAVSTVSGQAASTLSTRAANTLSTQVTNPPPTQSSATNSSRASTTSSP